MDGGWAGSTTLLCELLQNRIYTAILSFLLSYPAEFLLNYAVGMVEEFTVSVVRANSRMKKE